MNKLILFACIIFVAQINTALDHANIQSSSPNLPFLIPDFSASRNEVPVEDHATGRIIFYPPSVAKIAYIYLNVPTELRDAVMQQHGITQ